LISGQAFITIDYNYIITQGNLAVNDIVKSSLQTFYSINR